jgi:hypothetical protein
MAKSASESMNNALEIGAGIGGIILGWNALTGPMSIVSAAIGGIIAKAVAHKVLN